MFPKISSKVSGYIAMTSSWARWRPKSTASRLFAQSFVQVQIKENIKAPRHWPLRGESTGDRWIPSQKASNAKNVSIWWRHLEIHQDAVYKIEHTLIQPGLPCPLNEWLPFGSFESINGWFRWHWSGLICFECRAILINLYRWSGRQGDRSQQNIIFVSWKHESKFASQCCYIR